MALSFTDPTNAGAPGPRDNGRWNGRRVTLMGLGRHGGGLAAARFLVERGARLVISDAADRAALRESLDALAGLPIEAVKLGGHDPADFARAECVVVNPAVRPDHPRLAQARAAGAQLTSEIELFLSDCPARVIGVTGSNGKSTTSAMLAEILIAAGRRTWLGGNIGHSLLGNLRDIRAADWVVLELSSFQLAHLGAAARLPRIAVVTNCTPNHLDWHGNFARYAQAKRRLLADSRTLAVLDPRDPVSGDWRHRDFGPLAASWPREQVPRLAVPGDHNRHNAALAAAAAQAAGADRATIRSALASFRGLEHRLELVGEIASRRFYNDSKSTTPHATAAALTAVDGPAWLLAGGVSKGADFGDLARCVVGTARGAALFGQSAAAWHDALLAECPGFEVHRCESLAEALAWSWRRSRAGDAILLSPACASFDQFDDFRARGAAFRQLVRRLAASRAGPHAECASCQPSRASLG